MKKSWPAFLEPGYWSSRQRHRVGATIKVLTRFYETLEKGKERFISFWGFSKCR